MSGSIDRKTAEKILGADIWGKPPAKGGIYLAGPMGNRQQINNVAERLIQKGIPIVSTWHAIEPPKLPSREYLAAAAGRNHADLATATLAAFVVHRGSPCETWVELGAALARGIRVLVLYTEGTLDTLPISVLTVDREIVAWRADGAETKRIAERIQAWHRGTL